VLAVQVAVGLAVLAALGRLGRRTLAAAAVRDATEPLVALVAPVSCVCSRARCKETIMGLNQRHPTLFGRVIKPMMLLLTLTMIIVAQSNFRGLDRGVDPPLAWGLAVMAVVAALCLIVGWVSKKRRLMEYGLLAVVLVYLTRAAFIMFSSAWDQAVFFSLAVVVSASLAYFMEVSERMYDRYTGVAVRGVL
jgi:hypothetical protein